MVQSREKRDHGQEVHGVTLEVILHYHNDKSPDRVCCFFIALMLFGFFPLFSFSEIGIDGN